MIELRLKLGQLQRSRLQSSRFQLTTPREDFSLERLFPSRGFLPREGFSLERVLCLERVCCLERVWQIQNLTCRFLVVNQVHYKDPSMVWDGKESYFKPLTETSLASKGFSAG